MDADWKTDPNYDKMRRVLDTVAAERARQESDKRRGARSLSCAERDVSSAAKLPVLVNALGSAAGEIIDLLDSRLPEGTRPYIQRRLREDLIEIAAVAVAWAESLTEERQP